MDHARAARRGDARTADPEDLREQAAAWIVCLQDADPDDRARLEAECETWLAADAQRRKVFEQMRQMWRALEPARERRRRGRRVAGGSALVLLAVLVAQLPWSYWNAEHRAAHGDIHRVALPDGSKVVLNSNSAVDVAYDEQARVVRLIRGELMAVVATDAAGRPFRVVGPHGSAAALGTRYSVRLGEHDTRVAVLESAVRLTPRQAPERAVTLRAGRQARLGTSGVSRAEPAASGMPDWVDGDLVFNDVPLDAVIERLERHRRGIITVADTAAARERRFTGVLPTGDSDAALALLADALGLEVRRITPWFVRLEPRG